MGNYFTNLACIGGALMISQAQRIVKGLAAAVTSELRQGMPAIEMLPIQWLAWLPSSGLETSENIRLTSRDAPSPNLALDTSSTAGTLAGYA